MKKRIFAALLLALLLALGASAQALADEPEAAETPDAPPSGGVFQNGSFSGPQTIPGEPMAVTEDGWKAGLYAAVLNAWRAGETSVNVEPLKIPSAEWNALWDVLRAVLNDNPELFYASWYTSKDIYYYPNGPLLGSLTLLYNDTYQDSAVRTQAIREFNEAADRALAQIQGLTNPVEKALLLHDFLVVNCLYNWEVATDQEDGDAYVASKMPWTAYGALVKGDAVCQGYALAYKYLLTRAGIPSVVISSSSMNHAWNGVQIDGDWYQADPTWDDPTPNREGRARHAYFLLSDTTFGSDDSAKGRSKHYDWDAIVTCNSTEYESGYVFVDNENSLYHWNNSFYFIDNDGYVCKSSQLQGSGTRISGSLGLPALSTVWLEDRLYLLPNAYNDSYASNQRLLLVYDLDDNITAQAALFQHVPAASPDGKYQSSSDRIPGIRYNAETNKIEVVSPTRRTVITSIPASSLSSGWKTDPELNISSGMAVASGISKDGAAAIQWAHAMQNPRSDLTLWAAFYQDGKLTAVRTTPVQAQASTTNISNIRPTKTLAYLSALPSSYDTVKLILLTPDKLPLCAVG